MLIAKRRFLKLYGATATNDSGGFELDADRVCARPAGAIHNVFIGPNDLFSTSLLQMSRRLCCTEVVETGASASCIQAFDVVLLELKTFASGARRSSVQEPGKPEASASCWQL